MFQDGDPNPLDRATLGYVIVPWQGVIGEDAALIDAKFGDQIVLMSCACVETAIAGSDIIFTLYCLLKWSTSIRMLAPLMSLSFLCSRKSSSRISSFNI